MSQQKYYGENSEGILIAILSLIIILSMIGAGTLMSRGASECRASDYTYCGENAADAHGATAHE